MVVIKYSDKKSLYIDGFLKKNYDFVKDRVLTHKDLFICLIDGRSGTGKSTIASQSAYYFDNTATVKKTETFSLTQFEERCKGVKKGESIILDEAFELNKRKTQSLANMKILRLLQQIREKQCFIFIVLPFVYDLDKNVILGLSDLFIHCYRKDFGRRGQYSVYDRHKLKKLWLHCRQTYSYSLKVAKPNFRGRFTQQFMTNYKAYVEKKNKTLEEAEKKEESKNKYVIQRNKLIYAMRKKGIPVKDICKGVGLKQRIVYTILEQEKTTEKE